MNQKTDSQTETTNNKNRPDRLFNENKITYINTISDFSIPFDQFKHGIENLKCQNITLSRVESHIMDQTEFTRNEAFLFYFIPLSDTNLITSDTLYQWMLGSLKNMESLPLRDAMKGPILKKRNQLVSLPAIIDSLHRKGAIYKIECEHTHPANHTLI